MSGQGFGRGLSRQEQLVLSEFNKQYLFTRTLKLIERLLNPFVGRQLFYRTDTNKKFEVSLKELLIKRHCKIFITLTLPKLLNPEP